MMNKTTQGRRLLDGESPKVSGDYVWMPYSGWALKPSSFLGAGEWHVMDPTGGMGAIGRLTINKSSAHTWEIHNDGSVTFSPSLIMPSGWHGFLICGVFSEC